MKTKVTSILVMLIVIGAILFSNFGDLVQGKEVLPTLFLSFFAAIVVLQLIPAIFLFCVILREILFGAPKAEVEAGVDEKRGH